MTNYGIVLGGFILSIHLIIIVYSIAHAHETKKIDGYCQDITTAYQCGRSCNCKWCNVPLAPKCVLTADKCHPNSTLDKILQKDAISAPTCDNGGNSYFYAIIVAIIICCIYTLVVLYNSNIHQSQHWPVHFIIYCANAYILYNVFSTPATSA
jgi:hypothetical protein